MHPTFFAPALLAGLLASAAVQAAVIELDGIGLSRDVPCNGQAVNISGNGNRIQLTGDCGAVEVYGSDHQVSLQRAAALTVSGAENSVQADTVGRLSVDTNRNRVRTAIVAGAEPAAVEVSGAEHELELRFDAPAQVSVEGADNRLLWQGQEPQFAVGGVDQRIERKP